MRSGCLLAACVALGGTLTAQQPGHFSSSADLVVLHATVTDRRGAFVSGLPQEAFSVLEDGAAQSLAFFREQDAPVTVGLLIDASGSMAQNRDRVVAAVTAFAEGSHPDDEFFAMAFNERVETLMPAGTPFTSDPDVVHAALASGLRARGRTALYDALSAALDEVSRGGRERKVVIVVSDGGDNASETTFAEALRKAQSSNAVVYTIGLVDPLVRDPNPKLLRRFAEATGGRSFDPPDVQRVDDALEDVSLEIRSSYTLAYVPSNMARDGALRQVRVGVAAPDGRRLSIRTRRGYVAPFERRAGEEVAR